MGDSVEVGSSTTFRAWNFVSQAYEQVAATCRKVGRYCDVFVADDQWETNVGQSQMDDLVNAFDHQTAANPNEGIRHIVASTFGSPPDVDGDGRQRQLDKRFAAGDGDRHDTA